MFLPCEQKCLPSSHIFTCEFLFNACFLLGRREWCKHLFYCLIFFILNKLSRLHWRHIFFTKTLLIWHNLINKCYLLQFVTIFSHNSLALFPIMHHYPSCSAGDWCFPPINACHQSSASPLLMCSPQIKLAKYKYWPIDYHIMCWGFFDLLTATKMLMGW